jgi:hypothetical protein
VGGGSGEASVQKAPNYCSSFFKLKILKKYEDKRGRNVAKKEK